MTSHKILTTILILLAIFLGISVFLQNKKTDKDDIVPPVNNEQVMPTTTESTPTTPQATATSSEKFFKEVALTTQNYFEFPDNSVLSIKKVNDSRCAANVNCVWVGNIIAIFNIKRGSALLESFDLKFGPGATSTSHLYNGYTMRITNVGPDRGTTNQILGQKDYTVGVQISK